MREEPQLAPMSSNKPSKLEIAEHKGEVLDQIMAWNARKCRARWTRPP